MENIEVSQVILVPTYNSYLTTIQQFCVEYILKPVENGNFHILLVGVIMKNVFIARHSVLEQI